MKYQIIVDSSCDLLPDYLKEEDIGFKVIPLSLYIGEDEYIDDENLDVDKFVQTMNESKERIRSACPSVEAWADAYSGAEYSFVVTMTSNLSGTFNSAIAAREEMENKDKIFVFDSKSTGGSMQLIVDYIASELKKETPIEELVKNTEEFIASRNLFFILHKFDNLIQNGRMSKFAGLVAKTLVIKPICTASNIGTIEVCNKVVGSLKAYKKLTELVGTRCTDFEDRKLVITHCNNEEDAIKIKDMLCEKYAFKEVVIMPMRGLCSTYAEEKGIIVCY